MSWLGADAKNVAVVHCRDARRWSSVVTACVLTLMADEGRLAMEELQCVFLISIFIPHCMKLTLVTARLSKVSMSH
jgi:hypothetical protein